MIEISKSNLETSVKNRGYEPSVDDLVYDLYLTVHESAVISL